MSAKVIRPLDFQVTPEAFERSTEIHEHHGAFQEGPHPDFEDDYYEYDDRTGVDLDKCPYCRGSGYVNPLTASERQGFITGTEECAACDGTGHIL